MHKEVSLKNLFSQYAFLLIAASFFLWVGQAVAGDALQDAPDSHTLLLENENVRVLDAHLKPGQTMAMHSHPHHLVYSLADAKISSTGPDGKTVEVNLPAAQTTWNEPLSHSVVNNGDTDMHNIVIELKK